MTNKVRMAQKHTHLKDGMFRLEGGETCQEDHYVDKGHTDTKGAKKHKRKRVKPKNTDNWRQKEKIGE